MAKALTTAFAGTGKEPVWGNAKTTQSDILRAFNFYSYHHDYKDAFKYIAEYLQKAGDRGVELKKWKKVPARSIPNSIGWYARMITRGYQANKVEIARVENAIAHAFTLIPTKVVVEEEKPKSNKPTIQEIMKEKADYLGGDLEYLLDQFIDSGAKARHNLSPIAALKTANILPQHIPALVTHWTAVKKEFDIAYKGVDKDLNEGYGHLTKIQLRNLVKFADLVISDLNSYVTFKKATKAKPKRKIKTPKQQVMKLKYARKNDELNLKSVAPEKIIGAKEMFVFSPKKRKLFYYIADEDAGNALMVKNNTIVGFDVSKTAMKTVRDPKKKITEFMKASKPQSRKLFKGIRAVEAKVSGRFAEDLIILKVW